MTGKYRTDEIQLVRYLPLDEGRLPQTGISLPVLL